MKTYKVVFNSCFGGFSLSEEAILYARKKYPNSKIWFPPNCVLIGEKYSDGSINDLNFRDSVHLDCIERHNKELVEVVETLGKKANGACARLKVEVMDTPLYKIEEYDGNESVVTSTQDPGWINAEE